MRNDSNFYMRLPSTLLKTIRLTAAAHGVSVSEFIRDAAECFSGYTTADNDDKTDNDPGTAE